MHLQETFTKLSIPAKCYGKWMMECVSLKITDIEIMLLTKNLTSNFKAVWMRHIRSIVTFQMLQQVNWNWLQFWCNKVVCNALQSFPNLACEFVTYFGRLFSKLYAGLLITATSCPWQNLQLHFVKKYHIAELKYTLCIGCTLVQYICKGC